VLSGCTISSQFDPLFASAEKAETTGSIGAMPRVKQAGKPPSDGDLAYARAAASEVLRRNEKDTSLPWENPQSGARGTVTPIASAYTQDGHTCRNFLASYVNGRDEAWLTGEACRQDKGAWEVRSLKPWKRS
jgi:surface antigen